MKLKPRIKKIFLGLLFLMVLDELVVHRTQSIAPALVVVPVMYEVAATAGLVAAALINAYITRQTPRDQLNVISRVLPKFHDDLQDLLPEPVLPKQTQPTHAAQAIEQGIIAGALQAVPSGHKLSVADEQAIIEHIQNTIIAPTVERVAHITYVPTFGDERTTYAPEPSVHVSYIPGGVRLDIPAVNAYLSASIGSSERITPLRQYLIAQNDDWAMESAITEYLYRSNPAYRADFLNRLSYVHEIIQDLNSPNINDMVHARLSLPDLDLEEPLNYVLQQVTNRLMYEYFDESGKLIHTRCGFTEELEFTVASFLKNGMDERAYFRLLEENNLKKVIASHNSIGKKLWCIAKAVGRWPGQQCKYHSIGIKNKVRNHSYNWQLKSLLKDFAQGDFVSAYKKMVQSGDSLQRQMFYSAYRNFCKECTDEYGALKGLAHDPLWADKTDKAKRIVGQNIVEVTKLNCALNVRRVKKNRMQEEWCIHNPSPVVERALYELLDSVGTGVGFVEKTSELLATQFSEQDRKDLVAALYLPNGILKDFGHYPGVQNVEIPETIFLLENAQLLKELNVQLYTIHTAVEESKVCKAESALQEVLILLHEEQPIKEKQPPVEIVSDEEDEKKSGGGGGKPPEDEDEDKKKGKTQFPSTHWGASDALRYLQSLGSAAGRAALGLFGIDYEEIEKIYYALKEVPGFLGRNSAFQKNLENIWSTKGGTDRLIRGMWYELQCAYRLHTNGEKIVELGKKIPQGELDIITEKYVIECKDVVWEQLPDFSRYFESFGRQLKYSKEILDKQFVVFSKKPLPEPVKKWLTEKGIQFFEGLKWE